MMDIFKKKTFSVEISNVIYLLNKLKHDKGNFNLRFELAENLENLNNISDALFHLIVAHELEPDNQHIIKKIVKNLININDFYEAKKWSLKLDKNNELLNTVELLDDQFEVNKLLYFGSNFTKYSFCLIIDTKSNFDDFLFINKKKIEDSKIIYIEKDSLSLFDQFYKKSKNNIKNIEYIFTETDAVNDITTNTFSKSKYSNAIVNKMISSFIKNLKKENLKLYLRT